MTGSQINRYAAAALTAALALGAAGPAAARQIGSDGQVPVTPPAPIAHHDEANLLPLYVPKHMKALPEMTAAPVQSSTPRDVVSHPAPAGNGSDLVYILVGGVVFAVGGLGGGLAATRRRGGRTTAPARPKIAA